MRSREPSLPTTSRSPSASMSAAVTESSRVWPSAAGGSNPARIKEAGTRTARCIAAAAGKYAVAVGRGDITHSAPAHIAGAASFRSALVTIEGNSKVEIARAARKSGIDATTDALLLIFLLEPCRPWTEDPDPLAGQVGQNAVRRSPCRSMVLMTASVRQRHNQAAGAANLCRPTDLVRAGTTRFTGAHSWWKARRFQPFATSS